MKETTEYRGWTINTSRQRHHQFPDWLATCWQGNVMRFSVEGRSREEALANAQ